MPGLPAWEANDAPRYRFWCPIGVQAAAAHGEHSCRRSDQRAGGVQTQSGQFEPAKRHRGATRVAAGPVGTTGRVIALDGATVDVLGGTRGPQEGVRL